MQRLRSTGPPSSGSAKRFNPIRSAARVRLVAAFVFETAEGQLTAGENSVSWAALTESICAPAATAAWPPHRPARRSRHQPGVPSFLRIDFRDPSHLRKSVGDGLVMRVDWCV